MMLPARVSGIFLVILPSLLSLFTSGTLYGRGGAKGKRKSLRAFLQSGRGSPVTREKTDTSRTEYRGLLAGLGNSAVVMGMMLADRPENLTISVANSYQLIPPSVTSVTWYMP